MKIFYFCLWILSATSCLAQREAENWYFGTAGLSFKNGEPVLLKNSAMNSLESAATISDAAGNLLFYTDGAKVWDSTHSVMKNGTGLKGGFSSTQGALILPAPGKNNLFYIFTPGTQTNNSPSGCKNCAHYSLVDMSRNDGLGEVTEKNILLKDAVSVSEKLTATIDCSGKGYWIIFHHESQNIFYTYHLTDDGLSEAVVSSAGVNVAASNPSAYIFGQMKVSPNGKKIALANYGLELFDFDNTSGRVSPKSLQLSAAIDYNSFYSVEFSPDNTRLYADAGRRTTDKIEIIQFTIDDQNAGNVILSLETIANISSTKSLQLAPNGKIYTAWNMDDHIGVINFPNARGSASGYNENILSMEDKRAANFPNFPGFYFHQGALVLECLPPVSNFTADDLSQPFVICKENTVQFRDSTTGLPTSWKWTFEGGLPAEFDGKNPPPVFFKESGSYRIMLIAANEFGADTAFKNITVRPAPLADAGEDVTVCAGGSVLIGTDSIAGYSYKWTPTYGIDNSLKARPLVKLVFGTPEKYLLKVTDQYGCVGYDTVVVSPGEIIATVNVPDTTICIGNTVLLKASGGAEYAWSPADGLSATSGADVTATPLVTTTYRLIASSGDCGDTTFITIAVATMPEFTANDMTLCLGESRAADVSGGEGAMTWKWTPADGLSNAAIRNPTITAFKNQTYTISATNAAGCTLTKTVRVSVPNSDKTRFMLQSDIAEIEPGGSTIARLLISPYSEGCTSFTARIFYEPRIFRFEPTGAAFLKGADNSWSVRCEVISPGELFIEARGITPMYDGELAIPLNAFLARQEDDSLRIAITELNGKAVAESGECSRVETHNMQLLLKDVCAGDMRLVKVGEFQTFLKAVAPNPVSGELMEVHYELGIEGAATLTLYDQTGNLVKTIFSGYSRPGAFSEKVYIRDIASGMYALRLATPQGIFTQQVIIGK